MDRWQGKVAVVTDANGGVGSAIVAVLLNAGMIVVGLQSVSNLVAMLSVPHISGRSLHRIKCDVTDEYSVKAAFSWIETNFGCVNVLINNAGLISRATIDKTRFYCQPIDINVIASAWCTRESLQLMRKQNVTDGQVIMISRENELTSRRSRFSSNKNTISALLKTLRQEFQIDGSPLKITKISTVRIQTGIFSTDELMKMKTKPMINAADISFAILQALSSPPDNPVYELAVNPIR